MLQHNPDNAGIPLHSSIDQWILIPATLVKHVGALLQEVPDRTLATIRYGLIQVPKSGV
jgi:hypothetical protein